MQESNDRNALQETVIFQFPNELQKEIFERAATLNGVSAFSLTQVASYVNIWLVARPVLGSIESLI